MSAPAFLTSNYCFNRYFIATDVNNIITAFRTEVTTRNSPAWTEPSPGLFVSPPDAAGRFFDVLLTRIDATWLECRIRDHLARTICTRRASLTASGVPLPIFTSQFYFYFDTQTANLRGGILDQSPDAQGAHASFVFGGGTFTNTGSNDSNNSTFRCYMWDLYSGNGGVENRVAQYNNGGSNGCIYSQNGSRIYHPVEMSARSVDGSYRVAGRHYQALLCPSDMMPGARVRVPVDDLSGVFEVLGISGAYGWRMMLRVA
jgi:hypothetical protein